MVLDVIDTTNKNLKKYKPKTIKDIYKQKRLIVNFSEKMERTDKEIKFFLAHNMYNHKDVLSNANKGKKIVEILFNHLSKKTSKYIGKKILNINTKERAIADFIAGMTDRYAINLYKTLK